jgi:hypothetical protein
MEQISSFDFTEVQPSEAQVEFTMHSVSPNFVVDLCLKIHGKAPDAYLVHIKGYEWEFKEGLTEKAQANLKKSLEYFQDLLKEPEVVVDGEIGREC